MEEIDGFYMTPLFAAIQKCTSLNEIRQLMKIYDPEEPQFHGATALHMLISASKLPQNKYKHKLLCSVLKLLFKRVKNVNPVNYYGHTPITLGTLIDAPAYILGLYIYLMWQKHQQAGPKHITSAIRLYFENSHNNHKCNAELTKALLLYGGNIYPLWSQLNSNSRTIITYNIINILCDEYTSKNNHLDVLQVLLQAGLDLTRIEGEILDKWTIFLTKMIEEYMDNYDYIVPEIMQHCMESTEQRQLSSLQSVFSTDVNNFRMDKKSMKKRNVLNMWLSQPLSLQVLSARTVRINLRPNALVGIKKLNILPKPVQDYVVFGCDFTCDEVKIL